MIRKIVIHKIIKVFSLSFILLFFGCFSTRDIYRSNFPNDENIQNQLAREYGDSYNFLPDFSKSEILLEVLKGNVLVKLEDSNSLQNMTTILNEPEVFKFKISTNSSTIITVSSLSDESVFKITNGTSSHEYVVKKTDSIGKVICISNYIN